MERIRKKSCQAAVCFCGPPMRMTQKKAHGAYGAHVAHGGSSWPFAKMEGRDQRRLYNMWHQFEALTRSFFLSWKGLWCSHTHLLNGLVFVRNWQHHTGTTISNTKNYQESARNNFMQCQNCLIYMKNALACRCNESKFAKVTPEKWELFDGLFSQ